MAGLRRARRRIRVPRRLFPILRPRVFRLGAALPAPRSRRGGGGAHHRTPGDPRGRARHGSRRRRRARRRRRRVRRSCGWRTGQIRPIGSELGDASRVLARRRRRRRGSVVRRRAVPRVRAPGAGDVGAAVAHSCALAARAEAEAERAAAHSWRHPLGVVRGGGEHSSKAAAGGGGEAGDVAQVPRAVRGGVRGGALRAHVRVSAAGADRHGERGAGAVARALRAGRLELVGVGQLFRVRARAERRGSVLVPLRDWGAATERRRRRDERPRGRRTRRRGRDRVGAERDAEERGSEGGCGVSVAALAASKLRRRGRGGRRPGRATAPRGVVLARAVRPVRPER
mmetsp:Transcript_13855/g.60504  ORF Transcript_13855/g.60504 Transcript_13855/m.60504 type:complete len:342 (-) Transcript_13855:738-1763(-)